MAEQAAAADPAAAGFEWVVFNVPMEGPRSPENPKGVSRRPGMKGLVPLDEAQRLVERGMAYRTDADGNAIREQHVATPAGGGQVAAVEAPEPSRADSGAGDGLADDQAGKDAAAEAEQRKDEPATPPVDQRRKPTEKAVKPKGEKAAS